MAYEEIIDSFDCLIAEMGGAASASAFVPLDKETIERVSAGDDDPRFATFCIESGWSSNKRYWPPEIFDSVSEQINGDEALVGYLGHIKPDDAGYTFPEIQVQWLKAKLEKVGDKARLFIKGYVLPNTKGRDYLQRGLVKTVSWQGDALAKAVKGGVAVSEFRLKSIDLSRPRAAGMSAKLVGGLTSEMDEGSDEVKPDEIKALTANELRAYNPELVTAIEAEARKPLETQVSEMEGEVATLKPQGEILNEVRGILGVDASADVVASLKDTLTKLKKGSESLKDSILEAIIGKKFKDDTTKSLVKRLLVSEMEGVEIPEDEAEAQKAVEAKVNEIIDGDEDLKKLVSEMEGSGGSNLPNGASGRSQERKLEPGYENDNIRVVKGRR